MASSRRIKLSRSIVLITLLALATLAGPFKQASASITPTDTGEVGMMLAMAVDNVGGGWGFADANDIEAPGRVFHLANGQWTEIKRTDPALGTLATSVSIYKFVLSGDGKSGWAIGTGGSRLWRLRDGVWSDATIPFSNVGLMSDITLSADGKAGFLSVTILYTTHYLLAKLYNGQWIPAANPIGAEVETVAISSDGKHGWGVGPTDGRAKLTARALLNGNWTGPALDVPSSIVQVVADDQGNGWALGAPAQSAIIRLTANRAYQVLPYPVNNYPGIDFQDIAVNGVGNGWLTATYNDPGDPSQNTQPANIPLLFRLEGDLVAGPINNDIGLTPQSTNPNFGQPLAISPDGAHTWMAISSGTYRLVKIEQLGEGWNIYNPQQASPLVGPGVCFTETKYCLRGPFADFWQKHGGAAILGFPVTPEVLESLIPEDQSPVPVVQYTQNARLELHISDDGTTQQVLLSLLGSELFQNKLADAPFLPAADKTNATTHYFAETRHNLASPFLPYWKANGGLSVFGYPISEQFTETSSIDGKPYLTQYFERSRIEYHPANGGTQAQFVITPLGKEAFQAKYGYQP